MNIYQVVKKYIPLVIILVGAYIIIVLIYALFGYGTVEFNQKPDYVTIDGRPYAYTQGQKIKLRPGSYVIKANTINNEIYKTVSIVPFGSTKLSVDTKTDYNQVIKSAYNLNESFKYSDVKQLDNWLVGVAHNDEVSIVVALKYVNNVWTQVDSYTLSDAEKPSDAKLQYSVPPAIYNYIKNGFKQ